MISRRPYRSPLREEKARTTRARVLRAASELFLKHGYASTTLQQIATRASIALPTLTGLFATKRALLEEVLRAAVRGDTEETLLTRRTEFQAILDTPDPLETLRRWAALIRSANERAFDLFEILRKAAPAEPELELRRHAGSQDRHRDQTRIARELHRRGALRQGVSARAAADALWFYSSSDVYRLLVAERGWSADHFETWLADAVACALLPETNSLLRPGSR